MKNFMFAFTFIVAFVSFFVGFSRGYDKGHSDGFAQGDHYRERIEVCLQEHPGQHGICAPLYGRID